MDSLKVAEAASAAVAVAPRVKLTDIDAAIAARFELSGREAAHEAKVTRNGESRFDHDPLALLSICILVMRNGFTVIGKSAPASPENFNADLGRQYAYEDAVRQLWPLMGFALRDRLAAGEA